MTRILLAILLVATAVDARTPAPIPDGQPFGRIGQADVDGLQEFALTRGFDLKAEMARVYSPDNKLDEEALGRVFIFSRQFNTLDQNARTYGQIIYSSFRRVGEVVGVPRYVKIIDRQPPDVQQRVRDFLFYPFTRHRKFRSEGEALKEIGDIYPGLFPKPFQFGRGDPIFANET
jgi:hypothetical protein